MKYVYLVFMDPYSLKGPSQGKTLLGVHSSRKRADEHFQGVTADRKSRKDYVCTTWYGTEVPLPDWCNRRIQTARLQYKRPEPGTACPDWYHISEAISLEQWRVSPTRKPRLKLKRKAVRRA